MSHAFQWTDAAVRAALSLPRPSGDTDWPVFSQISTDTRGLQPGALFVALVGDRFDAHEFVDVAVDAGAAGLVVSGPVDVPDGVAVYRVRDTLVALGDLARFRRRTLGARVVVGTAPRQEEVSWGHGPGILAGPDGGYLEIERSERPDRTETLLQATGDDQRFAHPV